MRVVHDATQLDALLEEAQGEGAPALAMLPSSWRNNLSRAGIWKSKSSPIITVTLLHLYNATALSNVVTKSRRSRSRRESPRHNPAGRTCDAAFATRGKAKTIESGTVPSFLYDV